MGTVTSRHPRRFMQVVKDAAMPTTAFLVGTIHVLLTRYKGREEMICVICDTSSSLLGIMGGIASTLARSSCRMPAVMGLCFLGGVVLHGGYVILIDLPESFHVGSS